MKAQGMRIIGEAGDLRITALLTHGADHGIQAKEPCTSGRICATHKPMTLTIPTWIDGELTPVEKLRAHQLGLPHKAVSVFVTHGTAVLLQRRALGKYHTPGLWANTCCTHPHWGEDPLHCAERRLTEELGLTGIPLLFRDQVEYRADVGGGMIEHEVVDIYLGQVAQPVMPQPNPDEVCDTAWVEMADLVQDVRAQPERYTPWLRIYLERHAQVIFA